MNTYVIQIGVGTTTEKHAMTAPKILGITDEVTVCGCCGKSNLKKTVALDFDGDVRYYGTDCAAKTLLGKKSSSNRKTVEDKAGWIALAQRWLDRGFTPEQVVKGLEMRCGYFIKCVDGVIFLGGVPYQGKVDGAWGMVRCP